MSFFQGWDHWAAPIAPSTLTPIRHFIPDIYNISLSTFSLENIPIFYLYVKESKNQIPTVLRKLPLLCYFLCPRFSIIYSSRSFLPFFPFLHFYDLFIFILFTYLSYLYLSFSFPNFFFPFYIFPPPPMTSTDTFPFFAGGGVGVFIHSHLCLPIYPCILDIPVYYTPQYTIHRSLLYIPVRILL